MAATPASIPDRGCTGCAATGVACSAQTTMGASSVLSIDAVRVRGLPAPNAVVIKQVPQVLIALVKSLRRRLACRGLPALARRFAGVGDTPYRSRRIIGATEAMAGHQPGHRPERRA